MNVLVKNRCVCCFHANRHSGVCSRGWSFISRRAQVLQTNHPRMNRFCQRECSFNKRAQVLQPNESGKLVNEDSMW